MYSGVEADTAQRPRKGNEGSLVSKRSTCLKAAVTPKNGTRLSASLLGSRKTVSLSSVHVEAKP